MNWKLKQGFCLLFRKLGRLLSFVVQLTIMYMKISGESAKICTYSIIIRNANVYISKIRFFGKYHLQGFCCGLSSYIEDVYKTKYEINFLKSTMNIIFDISTWSSSCNYRLSRVFFYLLCFLVNKYGGKKTRCRVKRKHSVIIQSCLNIDSVVVLMLSTSERDWNSWCYFWE